MAFVPGYEYDVFISYAHVDNICFPDQGDGWIKQFYQNLNLMLAKRSGRLDSIKIWWDTKKLDGSVLFDDSIAAGIEKAAIMICLNSPGYKASKYCAQELDLFHKKAAGEPGGLKAGQQTRIFHVLLNNIPHTDWPDELQGSTGFPFHDGEDQHDFGDTVETTSAQFKAQMRHLKDAVFRALETMQEEAGSAPAPATPKKVAGKKPAAAAASAAAKAPETKKESAASEEGFTIFMSEVPDTLRSPRKRIISELEKNGYQVLAGIPPPDAKEELQKETEAALQSSSLAVNLLDIYPGREVVDAPDVWYPQFQTELSLKAEVDQLIWIPADSDFADIEEGEYRNFLTKLEEGELTEKRYEFIRGSKSSLARQIMDYAEVIQSKSAALIEDDGEIPVLLDAHENDHLYALDLGRSLLQNQFRPFINPQEDDPRKNLDLLGKRMSQVRKLIFLYGNVSKDWVLERMNAALQLILTNNYPIEDFFIYMAPPHKEAGDISINQRLLKVNVIDNSNDPTLTEQAVDRFLKELKLQAG